MEFRKIESSGVVVDYVAGVLSSHLKAGDKVLWLISGGSVIPVAVEVGRQLAGIDTKNLIVSLIDERYGDIGHADSNWKQLIEAGFSIPQARLIPVLQGEDMAETTKQFGQNLSDLLNSVDYRLAIFGMGPDGHTSGILPGSPAAEATGLTFSYDWTDYKRITTTPEAIALLDEAVLYAMGSAKQEALANLQQDKSISEQPAQLLKRVPKTTVFNDQTGDSA